MTVRRTETSIPGGFLNASFLGQAVSSDDDRYALVSYLGSPLRKGETRNYVKNTYIVFVDTEHVDETPEYHWTLEFFSGEDLNPFHTITENSNIGVFRLNTNEVIELIDTGISKLVISVEIDGTAVVLQMIQDVIGLYQGIETLIEEESDDGFAKGGNPPTSRLLANDYHDYIVNCGCLIDDEGEESGIPANLLASVIYLNLFSTPSDLIQSESELWEDYINDCDTPDELIKTPLGISQIRPHFLSMFLRKLNGTNGTITGLQVWDEESISKEKYEENVFDRYHNNASDPDKIDIINLLRFPKSSVYLSCYLLTRLKERHAAWKDLSAEEVLNSRECVHTIVSEYEKGPCVARPQLLAIGKKVYSTMFTPFIQSIASSYREYWVRVEGFDNVPHNLQESVRNTLRAAFQEIRGVVFDYDQIQPDCKSKITFDGDPHMFSFGDQPPCVYVEAMKLYRLALPGGGCEPAFEDTAESLGSHIANTAVHELAHDIGLNLVYAGPDAGDHVTDMNNYQWDASRHPEKDEIRKRPNDGIFEYTVVEGDTLSRIVDRWKNGQLDPCARGSYGLSSQIVFWETPNNKKLGFIAHPTKSNVPGRIANDPNYIYPGEKVSLIHFNFRTQEYRRFYPGWLGEKSFNDVQIRIMNEFVQENN